MISFDLFQALGWFSAGILPFVAVPQLVKLVRLRRSLGVSYGTYGMLFVGQGAQVVYATNAHAWPVVLAAGVGWLINSVVFTLMLVWRNRG